MIINCIRCGKGINSPNATNANYIMAKDTIVKEERDVFTAYKHNKQTLKKQAERKTLLKKLDGKRLKDKERVTILTRLARTEINDSQYTKVKHSDFQKANTEQGLVKVTVAKEKQAIQKTGIICPACYKKADFIIWGIAKTKSKL
jgi:hypothetical protein